MEAEESYTDRYIALLEANLATARHRILILQARCAILGDTGDDFYPPTPPASPTLSLASRPYSYRTAREASDQTSPRARQNLNSSSHGRVPAKDNLRTAFMTPLAASASSRAWTPRVRSTSLGIPSKAQKPPSHSPSSHKRAVSFSAVLTPSPARKSEPIPATPVPQSAIKPYNTGLHTYLNSLADSPAASLPQARPAQRISAAPRYISSDLSSRPRIRPRPVSLSPSPSLQQSAPCPQPLKYCARGVDTAAETKRKLFGRLQHGNRILRPGSAFSQGGSANCRLYADVHDHDLE
jgi:hypothetical protein